MQCPVCRVNITQPSTETCPQCQSDLLIHQKISELRETMTDSMNATTATTPSDQICANPAAEQATHNPAFTRQLKTNRAKNQSSHLSQSPWTGFFWGLQVAALAGLAVLAFLLFSSHQRLLTIENRSIQTEERLAKQVATVPDTTRLIDTLATLTQVLERTNQQYEIEQAEHRALQEQVKEQVKEQLTEQLKEQLTEQLKEQLQAQIIAESQGEEAKKNPKGLTKTRPKPAARK